VEVYCVVSCRVESSVDNRQARKCPHTIKIGSSSGGSQASKQHSLTGLTKEIRFVSEVRIVFVLLASEGNETLSLVSPALEVHLLLGWGNVT